jgi:hypothetical protein
MILINSISLAAIGMMEQVNYLAKSIYLLIYYCGMEGYEMGETTMV